MSEILSEFPLTQSDKALVLKFELPSLLLCELKAADAKTSDSRCAITWLKRQLANSQPLIFFPKNKWAGIFYSIEQNCLYLISSSGLSLDLGRVPICCINNYQWKAHKPCRTNLCVWVCVLGGCWLVLCRLTV